MVECTVNGSWCKESARGRNTNAEMKLAEKCEGLLMAAGWGTSVRGFLRWRAFDVRNRSHSKRSRAKDGEKADRGMACSFSLVDHRGVEALTPLGPTSGFGATADEGGGDLTTDNLDPKRS